MPSKDDFRKMVRSLKRDMDFDKVAFKTLTYADLTERLKLVAGTGAQGGQKTYDMISETLKEEGLYPFPEIDVDAETDTYVRVYRLGTLAAGIMNTIRYPGEASDRELAGYIADVKELADLRHTDGYVDLLVKMKKGKAPKKP